MKTTVFIVLALSILIALLLPCGSAFARHNPSSVRAIDPIVSSDWLDSHSGEGIILDIRSAETYATGHIPGAINEPFAVPFSAWITMRDDLLLEVPDEADLFSAIGNLGITKDSWVVIVTEPNPDEPPYYGLANATRVALTLIYAGLINVAILDGGYPKWVVDGLPVTTDVLAATPVSYDGEVNQAMFVSIEHVKKHLWKSDIVDARDADVYFGVTVEPFADKAGHIPKATSLPAPWIWQLNPDGTYTYKDQETLDAMACGVLRGTWSYGILFGQEIIVYCGVGGYASAWWFVLTQVLEYRNVKLYDGAAQEWVRYYDMVPYQWE